MKMHHGFVSACCALAFGFGANANATASPLVSALFAQTATEFVRVGASGARLTNLADRSAEPVLEAPAGTLLQVHSRSGEFLEVSTPGGLRVWVFGEYAKAASEPGMIEITANGVRMRPLPEATDRAFPLGQSLSKGEKLLYVGHADPNKPIQEDWIQVVSPNTAHAWLPAASTTPLAVGESGAQLWEAARAKLMAEVQPREVPSFGAPAAKDAAAKPAKEAKDAKPADKAAAGTKEAASEAKPKSKSTGDSFGDAEKLMEEARKAPSPNWTAVKSAYQRVIQETPSGVASDTARLRLQEIDARVELAELHAQAANAEQQRQATLVKKTEELRDAGLHNDPLWGRFQARGWIEKEGERYLVRWANRTRSQLTCSAHRYDLDAFVGFEVGVIGTNTRAASGSEQPAVIDAARIEVLSGAGTRR